MKKIFLIILLILSTTGCNRLDFDKLNDSEEMVFGAYKTITLIGTPQVGSTNNGGVVTLTFSERPSTGDVTIACAASPAATPAYCTAPTQGGYSVLANFKGTDNTQPTMSCWYKVQGATTDTQATVQGDGAATTDSTGIAFVLRNVDTSNVIDQASTTAGVTTSTNPDPAQIITQTDGAWVIVVAASVQAVDTDVGTISGYTNHYQVEGNDTYDHTHAMATKAVAIAGTENPGAWSSWSSGNWYAITMAIRPAPSTAPTVTTQAVSSIGNNTATGNGNVTSDGGATVTERGVVASTTPTPTTSDLKFSAAAGGTGVFTASMTSLGDETHYYVRAYAINSIGTSYGSQVEFDTAEQSPSVTLNTPSDTGSVDSATPDLYFTGTDAGDDDIEYNLQVATDNQFSNPQSEIADSYPESNNSTEITMGEGGPVKVGQSFTGNGSTLISAKFYLKKTGSPAGSGVARLYNMTGSFGTDSTPTGDPIDTSDSLDVSTLTTSFALKEFIFHGEATLENGTNYFITFEQTSGTWVRFTDDVRISEDVTSPIHAGNYAAYISSWAANSTFDNIFYVYGGVPGSLIINKYSSIPDATFTDVTSADTHPFTSGDQIKYTIQAGDALSNGQTYYWRVAGIDPGGSNTWGATTSPWSFTVSSGASSPASVNTKIKSGTLKIKSGTMQIKL